MITKTKYKKIKTYPRKDRRRYNSLLVPRIAFLLNCSSSKQEIVNEEGGIYRESFHITWAKTMDFWGRKSH
jgi:hypothetical protein